MYQFNPTVKGQHSEFLDPATIAAGVTGLISPIANLFKKPDAYSQAIQIAQLQAQQAQADKTRRVITWSIAGAFILITIIIFFKYVKR